jgi:hypothetical protein
VSITSWAIGKIPGFVISLWQQLSRRPILRRLIVSPIPELSRVPDASDNANELFVLAFRFFNENRESIVIRGLQPRMQVSANGKTVDPAAKLADRKGQRLEFPVVINSFSNVDALCAFRLADNSPPASKDCSDGFCVDSQAGRCNQHRVFFRDPDHKQIFVSWYGSESWFGEQRLKPGEQRVNVRFKKKLSAAPKMIVSEVVRKEPDRS